MNLNYLHQHHLIILEAIMGSQAYGTALPTSDQDIRGIFILPENDLFGMDFTEQVSDEKNDIVFYEIRRFLQLLLTNNPTIMELLNIPEDCIVSKHPVFDKIYEYRNQFITKKCKSSFGGYAVEQIRKARGLNKKMMQPVEKERKSPLDFCYVITDTGYGSTELSKFLSQKGWKQEDCGLVNIPNMKEVYALFHDENHHFKGIIKKENSDDIALSSVPEGIKPAATLTYNKDGFSSYCKKYREYWEWVEKRNPVRYNQNVEIGKGYDSKNMMHCHRLLDMAIEIGEGRGINVRRPNREELLSIRKGDFEYEKLLEDAEAKIKRMDKIYEKSDLPEEIDAQLVNNLLIDIRKMFYKK
jgi:hypothetical protein